MGEDTDSNAPIFDISSLPSVHEHDWRNTSLDTKTAATYNLEEAEDPYSDEFCPKEREVSVSPRQSNLPTREQQQQQQQQQSAPFTQPQNSQHVTHLQSSLQTAPPTAKMSNHVTFEGATQSPEEVVHINAMFNNNNNNEQTSQPNPLPTYVPNKYSAHHDPSMPDWEGVTIAERTMADISTLSPPPDDYYSPYTAPPMAIIATPPDTQTWEELEETEKERSDWRNPQYKDNSTISVEPSASLQPKDRKLIYGLIALVALLVVVVAVVVPVSLRAVQQGGDKGASSVVGQENVVVTTSPTNAPAMTSSPSMNDDAFVDGDPVSTTAPETVDPTTLPEVDPPSTGGPDLNGRETEAPTPSPVIDSSEQPTSPSNEVVESTPQPSTTNTTPQPSIDKSTPKPTSRPVSASPSAKPITSPPTPSPQSSLINSNLGQRPKSWLEAYNTRRQYYHESVYGTTYVPLVWSESLATQAQEWADAQNDGSQCSADTEGRDDIGQTGYAYWSTVDSGFDEPEDILTWWVDEEEGLDWDQNKKFTQAIWRASKYVGCGDSIHEFDQDGRTMYCRIYACNYIRKGNCNMDDYDDWTVPMLMDDTPCGDECPEEGCYWEAFNFDRMFS